jgi:glucokinase
MTLEAIGVDVGGTKIAALRVAADGTVHASEIRGTPADDAEAMVATMIDAATAVRTEMTVAVGIGAPGLVDGGGLVRYGPNMALRDVSLNDLVGGALGLPCTTENDATAATWGEYIVGAGQGSRHLLVVTVGTGIGGGIVTDGRIMRGAHGFAGEVGHVIVEPGGPRCGCGNHGCWEQVASGAAIARAGREAVARHAHSMIGELAGGDPDRATGSTVTEAARRGDPAALGILTEVGHRLGEGLAGLANVLDPDRIVVGGGAVDAGDLLLEPARSAFGRALEAPDHRPPVPIVPATLGNDAGAVGAALLAMDALA